MMGINLLRQLIEEDLPDNQLALRYFKRKTLLIKGGYYFIRKAGGEGFFVKDDKWVREADAYSWDLSVFLEYYL